MPVRRLEVAAVLATGLGRFVMGEWLGFHLAYVVASVTFWVTFVVLRHKADGVALEVWGLTDKGFARSLLEFGPPALAALIACVAWGGGGGAQRG